MTLPHWLTASAATAVVLAAAPAQAQAPQADFKIPAGPLVESLRLLSTQSSESLLYDPAILVGLTGPAVNGRMTTEAALRRLLSRTDLVIERTARGVLVVRLAAQAEAEAADLGEIVVTGTLLRGLPEGPSPVVTLTRDELDRQGHASVAAALAALPQNFGGTGNEGALQNGADRTGANNVFASGVNLRGLGSDATLVLVNGRRMAGTGARADFADISTLPAAAIERVDVLLDGASALYGSDAVGGVVNIILRQDFEGAETRLRVGSVTDGSASEYGAAQTFGLQWRGGGGLLSYEYLDREALPVSERRRAGDADLRPFGGSDWRSFYSHPGNLVVLDPATLSYRVTHALPDNPQGRRLTPADFRAGEVNLENGRAGLNVLPRQTRHSLYAAGHQDLGDRLTLSADLRYGDRRYESTSQPALAILTVDRRNPFFVSPTGASSHQIAYSFIDALGPPRIQGGTQSLGASLGVEARLPGDWILDGYVAEARENTRAEGPRQLNSAFLREALGTAADDPRTAFSAPRDGYFNPFAAGSSNPPAVLDFIGSGFSRSDAEMTTRSANLQLSGGLFELPAGQVQLAVGAAYRTEEQVREGANLLSGFTPTVLARTGIDRAVSAVFAEVRAPLFGPDFRRPGLERLELSLAGRYEDYDDVGSTANPKIGLLWAPVEDLLVRTSYGTSFRAPALRELADPAVNSPSVLPNGPRQTVTLIRYGGNPDLEPEEAVSWTAGVTWRPAARPGLELSADWFRTTFDRRIGQPALENILGALADPALAAFVRLIDPVNRPEDRAEIDALLADPRTNFASLFPAESYGAIIDARYVNTDRVEVEGLDVSGRYAFDVRADAYTVSGSVSRLFTYDVRSTPTAPVVAALDRPNFPLGFRGRAALDWSRDIWATRLTLHHTGDYEDLQGRRIDAWTTADAQLRVEPRAGPLAQLAVTLTVQNLFDTDPPFYDAPQGIAYDAANASVLGRFVSLQLSRRW